MEKLLMEKRETSLILLEKQEIGDVWDKYDNINTCC